MCSRVLALAVLGVITATGSPPAARRVCSSCTALPACRWRVYAGAAGGAVPATPTVTRFQQKQVVNIPDRRSGHRRHTRSRCRANPQTATPVIQVLGATVPDGVEVSIVAHLNAGGYPDGVRLP